jgi:uncharacterized protein (TIGR03663 family)
MRIAARTSSGADGALADSPTVQERIAGWRTQASEVDWTPWLIVALGAFLRLLLLGIKPPHFDEGINGWFVDQMTKTGFYKYDPTNYHGPLHFYVLFLSQTLLGRNLWALRLPVVLVSIFCIHLATKFEPLVGRNVSRLAALAMAVSPGFVFYGRYSIHEVWLVLFSMLFLLGIGGLWKIGSAKYLWCIGMGLTGMILTKETYIIHVGCAVIAAGLTWVLHLVRPTDDASPARQAWGYQDLAVVCGTAIALIVFFYSGTFFNWSGVKGLYQTFHTWFQTGHNGNGHEKPWYYWLMLICRYEWPVALGLCTCALAPFFKSLSVRFLAIYAVGTLLAYSIVHYKTPWCIISIVWPFLFMFGVAIVGIAFKHRLRAWITAAALLSVSLGSAIWLNYFRCSTYTQDDWDKTKNVVENIARFFTTEPYVYVQTYNDIWKLTRPLEKLTKHNPTYYQLVGHFIRTSTYPFPWLLGDFPKVGYYEHDNLPDKVDADFLIVQEDRIEEVEKKLRESYYTDSLTIRPYQDTSKVYFSEKVFKSFFPGREPDFVGKR